MGKERSLLNTSSAELTPNDRIQRLLKPSKTIRDAVHGDIMVTKLETTIMDTEEFQRLHKIKQLGLAHLVYPCAKHSRFEHSLGTLYMTQYLIDCVRKNPYKDSNFELTNYHILLARICALLHDLAHIPFGHTLEDEGFLFKSQWDDKDRVEYFLGDDSTVGRIIINTLKENGLDGGEFLQEIRNILVAKTEEDVENLRYPFIADIILNTTCADLLDYLARDTYFCGLRESYDERFLSYFYITLYKDKWRLILRLIKPRTGRVRRDVLSETLHLLRLRYSLAEKVYYHHTKISASAMLISAVNHALTRKVIAKKNLFGIGDDELGALVSKDSAARYLMDKLGKRELYKPVYKLSYLEERFENSARRRRETIEKFRNPRCRYEAERTLEDMNFLKQGQVVIYCPSPEMGQKAARTLVDWGIDKGPLDMVTPQHIRREIESSIVKKHLDLWNMYVFVDPELTEEQRATVATDCVTNIVKETNEMEQYQDLRERYLERYREKAEEELGITISAHKMKVIESASRKYTKEKRFFGDIITYKEFLEEVGKD